MAQSFDYLIVGAGYAGSVLAERLASGRKRRVLVVEKRPHTASNAFDTSDENGILIYREGPHIFYTEPYPSTYFSTISSALFPTARSPFETHDRALVQVDTINFPNDTPDTCVTEVMQLTGQRHEKSVLFKEPQAVGDPYYPRPRPENRALYSEYKTLAETRADVTVVGRLATYRYYNMDQVVAQALTTYAKLSGAKVAQPSGARGLALSGEGG